MIVNETDRAHLESLGPYAINSASTFGVLASTAAFTHRRGGWPTSSTYLDGNRRLLAELLASHLPDVGYTPPEGTYLTWLDCRRSACRTRLGDFFLDTPTWRSSTARAAGRPAGFVRLNIAHQPPDPHRRSSSRWGGRAARTG
jgi:cystathionine beta-lyase